MASGISSALRPAASAALFGTGLALAQRMRRALAVALLILAVTSCSRDPESPHTSEQVELDAGGVGEEAESARAEPVGFDMRRVHLRTAPDVVLHVEQLHGQLVPRSASVPAFEDLKSFYIAVESAELSMDGPSMTAIVDQVFNYKGSPLSDVTVAIREGRVEQKGKLRKGVWIPFSVDATVSADNGLIRLHPITLRVAGIPAAKMMSFFGIELDNVIEDPDKPRRDRSRQRPAARAVTDDAGARGAGKGHLRPGCRRPSAAGHGCSACRAHPTRRSNSNAGNYIWFHGSRIRFGRLTMTDADLQLIDADEQDPFDFNSARFNEEVVAGYSRNTRNGALRAVMPDYGDISRLPSGRLPDPPLARRTHELTPSLR